MRDWLHELPPGTMLFDKMERVFALVINARLGQESGRGWVLYLLLLDSKSQLLESSMTAGDFFARWYKVIT